MCSVEGNAPTGDILEMPGFRDPAILDPVHVEVGELTRLSVGAMCISGPVCVAVMTP